MNNVTLYSTHCPQCMLLEKQLKQKGIKFDVCDDVAKMLALGFSSAPILSVNGNYMRFAEALKWVRDN